jgi:hypothetical protein
MQEDSSVHPGSSPEAMRLRSATALMGATPMMPSELADRVARGEKWRVADGVDPAAIASKALAGVEQ